MESIRQGGLSIIGGILGGTISVLLVSYFKKSIFSVRRTVSSWAAPGAAIGRGELRQPGGIWRGGY
ncbi:MAG: hypothetical protein ACLRSW_08240 [Christensenellaceae bacterium]